MKLCIIGTGYVGLVTAACFAENGNEVFCVDTNDDLVESLNAGRIPIFEPGLASLVRDNIKGGRLSFSSSLPDGMKNSLFLFNCVGTPSKENGACDLSHVYSVADKIGEAIDEYKIVVNKSTVPIGTADDVRGRIENQLARRSLSIEFDVVSNPEFLKEGEAVNDFMKPDRIIIGTENIRTAKLMEALYAPFARSRDKIMVMNTRSAEMTKYTANCMLATKISFMNEMANICERVGADIEDVRKAIGADHRIGPHFIYPGVGYGGSCFPKDVRALSHCAGEKGYEAAILQSVDKVNNEQKLNLAQKILDYYARVPDKKKLNLALWGLSFKAKTDDIRESAAIEIIKKLTAEGVHIRAFDPAAGEKARQVLSGNTRVSILKDQYEVLQNADGLIIATDWNQFKSPNFIQIKKTLKEPVIFDGRNLYLPAFMQSQGFIYRSIGR